MQLQITWTLKTLGTFPVQPGKPLLSSIFYLDNYREVGFRLRIRGEFPINGGDQVGSLFLCRCDNDGPDNVEVEYKLAVISELERISKYKMQAVKQIEGSRYKTQFLKPQHNVPYWCFETDALPIKTADFSGSKLEVNCTILSYKNDEDVGSELGQKEDFVHLSEAFTELLDKSLFSDAVIQIPSKEFKIHKAVLQVRCPALLKECQTEKTEGAYCEYDEDTLQTMLEYVYTGKLKSENVPDELYCLLKHSNDSVFSHLFPTLPYLMYVETTYDVKEIDFRWTIENLLNFSQNKEWCNKIIAGDPFTWLKLTFHSFQSEDKTKHLEFMMHSMSQRPTAFVKCIINVLDTREARTSVFEGCYFFIDEHPWTVQLDHRISLISERELSGKIRFFIQLQIASGQLVNSVKYVAVQPTSCENVTESLHGLGHDIRKLYENRQHSDVVLKVKSKSIPAHKAILSARSEFFHQMLKTETAEVDINNLDEKVALSMVYYIYSDQVVNLDIDHAFELYKAAKLYEILPLKIKCSNFLEFSLDEKNAGEILVFADAENNDDLKSLAYKFIYSKRTGALKRKELIGIMKSFELFPHRTRKRFLH